MRSPRPLSLLAASIVTLLLAVSALPARAQLPGPPTPISPLQLHFRFARAANATPLDSLTISLISSASAAATGFDTSFAVPTRFIQTSGVVAAADTAHAASSSLLFVGPTAQAYAGQSLDHSLWLVVEVTGTFANTDSLYAGIQGSMGPNASNTNVMSSASFANSPPWYESGTQFSSAIAGQGDPVNWRWYDLIPTAVAVTATLPAVVNNTGSKTFVVPIPSITNSPNNWFDQYAIRVILQGDNNANALGAVTRAFLCWR